MLSNHHNCTQNAAVRKIKAIKPKMIAAVINIVDPDAIVIGGGVGNVDRLYHPDTRLAIRRHLFRA